MAKLGTMHLQTKAEYSVIKDGMFYGLLVVRPYDGGFSYAFYKGTMLENDPHIKFSKQYRYLDPCAAAVEHCLARLAKEC